MLALNWRYNRSRMSKWDIILWKTMYGKGKWAELEYIKWNVFSLGGYWHSHHKNICTISFFFFWQEAWASRDEATRLFSSSLFTGTREISLPERLLPNVINCFVAEYSKAHRISPELLKLVFKAHEALASTYFPIKKFYSKQLTHRLCILLPEVLTFFELIWFYSCLKSQLLLESFPWPWQPSMI